MSEIANGSIRCDDCGKLSRHPRGEYVRPDGSAGYINSKGRDSAEDYCDECAENRCPFCMSVEIVRITPAIAGPVGWASRCKACGQRWERGLQPVGAGTQEDRAR